MKSVKIISIKKKQFNGKMYNIAVEGNETYVANGIAVHNCRSTIVPVFAYEDYEVNDKPKELPDKGFGG